MSFSGGLLCFSRALQSVASTRRGRSIADRRALDTLPVGDVFCRCIAFNRGQVAFPFPSEKFSVPSAMRHFSYRI